MIKEVGASIFRLYMLLFDPNPKFKQTKYKHICVEQIDMYLKV